MYIDDMTKFVYQLVSPLKHFLHLKRAHLGAPLETLIWHLISNLVCFDIWFPINYLFNKCAFPKNSFFPNTSQRDTKLQNILFPKLCYPKHVFKTYMVSNTYIYKATLPNPPLISFSQIGENVSCELWQFVIG